MTKAFDLGQHLTRSMVSVKDSPFNAVGDGVADDTAALNAAFQYAQAQGRSVYLPGGNYLCGHLLFGNQSTTAQSNAPLGLFGDGKIASQIIAKPGLDGILLQSWSLSGVTFRDFGIITAVAGCTAVAWDCQWKAGVGPSSQCVIEHIMITVHDEFHDGTVGHLNLDNLNDTYPLGVTVRGAITTTDNCYISMVQSGGEAAITGCVWSGGFLRWGCQNGSIDHCWGHGIEFAAGCLNITVINSYYGYPNYDRRAIFWSQSKDAYQSIKALTVLGGQMIHLGLPNPDDAILDVCLYSEARFIGTEFIGDPIKMLSATSRNDSYAAAHVVLQGGHYGGNVTMNDLGGIVITAENFMNNSTGAMLTKEWTGTSAATIWGATTPGTANYISNTVNWVRRGNMVLANLRLTWDSFTGTGYSIINHNLPFVQNEKGIASMSYGGATMGAVYVATDGGQIFFNPFAGGGALPLPASGDIQLVFHIPVNA